MERWLAKGEIRLERLRQQDSRPASRTPAEAWGRGLVGETRSLRSSGTPSTIFFEEPKDHDNKEDLGPKDAQHKQIFIDTEVAAAIKEQQLQADRQVAEAIMNQETMDADIARTMAAENPNEPKFEPSDEAKQFWTSEPGVAITNEPQQIICNICTTKPPKPFSTFVALQEHKVRRHQYCIMCDMDFYDDEALTAHKISSPAHQMCAVCYIEFGSEDSLKDHMKQGTFPFKLISSPA